MPLTLVRVNEPTLDLGGSRRGGRTCHRLDVNSKCAWTLRQKLLVPDTVSAKPLAIWTSLWRISWHINQGADSSVGSCAEFPCYCLSNDQSCDYHVDGPATCLIGRHGCLQQGILATASWHRARRLEYGSDGSTYPRIQHRRCQFHGGPQLLGPETATAETEVSDLEEP